MVAAAHRVVSSQTGVKKGHECLCRTRKPNLKACNNDDNASYGVTVNASAAQDMIRMAATRYMIQYVLY